MRFTITTLVTVDVTNIDLLTDAAIHSAVGAGNGNPCPALRVRQTPATAAAAALTELAYPAAAIDGYPGVRIHSAVVNAVIPHSCP